MRFAIIYGTTEGQTRKVCRFIQNTLLEDGHASELLQATDSESTDLTHVDAVIAAGSVHAGLYQKELTDFVTTHANAMGYLPNMFVSVSLTAAGDDAEEWQGLEDTVKRMRVETGWEPGRVIHVAGAFKFGEYDFLKYWAMRWIESQKETNVKAGTDMEYTDWEKLAGDIRDWTSGLAAGT
ncbi:MAG: flavodoxin domain-containing protein [Paracoccaceae bacterium]|nr:flavodoxin domain-containing protein [Paracoccaceae bacterium]